MFQLNIMYHPSFKSHSQKASLRLLIVHLAKKYNKRRKKKQKKVLTLF